MMNDYLLVDGKNLLWRATAVMESLKAGGSVTGGIYGFLNVLIRVHGMVGGKTVVCWDDWKGGPAARRALFKHYKRRGDGTGKPDPKREEMVKLVITQQSGLMEFFKYLGVTQVRSPKWEADDVMGTLAKRYGAKDKGVTIFTGDRDLLQCMGDRCRIFRPIKEGEIREETLKTFQETYGITLEQFVDWKALVGDTSDNIPGCSGIGEKTATLILKSFTNVEHALAVAAAKNQPESWPAEVKERFRAKLLAEADTIRLSKKLATINCDAPLKFRTGDYDPLAAKKMLMKWRMKSLLPQFSNLKRLRGE